VKGFRQCSGWEEDITYGARGRLTYGGKRSSGLKLYESAVAIEEKCSVELREDSREDHAQGKKWKAANAHVRCRRGVEDKEATVISPFLSEKRFSGSGKKREGEKRGGMRKRSKEKESPGQVPPRKGGNPDPRWRQKTARKKGLDGKEMKGE